MGGLCPSFRIKATAETQLKHMKFLTHQRFRAKIIFLIVLVPLGFATKVYSGPGSGVVVNHAGGFLYVWFFMLLASLLFPSAKALCISAIVFISTSLIEFSQLIQTPWLNILRQHFLIRTLIGSTFGYNDFIWYSAAAVSGYFLLRLIGRKEREASNVIDD